MRVRKNAWRRRPLLACALVAALLAAVAISGRAQAAAESAPALRSDAVSVLAYVDDPDANPLFEGDAVSSVLPAWVERECFSLEGVREVRRSDDGVVGFLVEGRADEVSRRIADAMAERGWKDMPSGIPGTTGYFREGDGSGHEATVEAEGSDITWVLIAMTQIGDDVSVVLQTH